MFRVSLSHPAVSLSHPIPQQSRLFLAATQRYYTSSATIKYTYIYSNTQPKKIEYTALKKFFAKKPKKLLTYADAYDILYLQTGKTPA